MEKFQSEQPEEGYDYKEALLPPEEQAELNLLRKKQMEKEFSEEERKRFLELQDKENRLRDNRI